MSNEQRITRRTVLAAGAAVVAAGATPWWDLDAGRTFYVNGTDGDDEASGREPGEAWRTLRNVNGREWGPGDRLLFAADTVYEGPLELRGGGSPLAPVTVGQYGRGARPRIEGRGVRDAVLADNMEWVQLRDLEVTNTGEERMDWRTGVRVRAHNCGTLKGIVLEDLVVRDVNGSLVKQTEGCGIYAVASGNEPSRFDGLRVERCHVLRTDRNGLCMRSSFTGRDSNWFPSLNVVFRGNLIEDCGGDAIKPWGCEGALVEHNRVDKARQRCEDYAAGIWPWSCDDTVIQFNEVSGLKGTLDGQGFDSDYNCRHTVIQYNYSRDNEGGFLLVCGPERGSRCAGCVDTVVRYNISENDGFTGARLIHVSGGGVRRTRIYNNVIYVPEDPQVESNIMVKMDEWDGWAEDTLFANNLFLTRRPVTYEFGQARDTRYRYNAFTGPHEDMPDDPEAVVTSDNPGLADPGTGESLRELEGYKLTADSPLTDAAREMEDNGGRDFWGNAVAENGPVSIGAHERR